MADLSIPMIGATRKGVPITMQTFPYITDPDTTEKVIYQCYEDNSSLPGLTVRKTTSGTAIVTTEKQILLWANKTTSTGWIPVND